MIFFKAISNPAFAIPEWIGVKNLFAILKNTYTFAVLLENEPENAQDQGKICII